MSRRKYERELSLKEMQKISTTLYDCSITLKIEIPHDEHVDINMIHKITLTTIAHEFIRKHSDHKDMIDLIYLILKKTLSTTKNHWKVLKKDGKILKKNRKNSGHILDFSVSEIFYDTIKFSGQVVENYDYSGGPVNVDCSVELFLSPAVYAGRYFYEEHKFPVSIPDIRKKSEYLLDIIQNWCCELDEHEKSGWNFGDYWGWLSGGLQEHHEYWESKRLRYLDSPPRDYDDEDDSDEEDESEGCEAFFKGLKGLAGAKRRRRDDCCLS